MQEGEQDTDQIASWRIREEQSTKEQNFVRYNIEDAGAADVRFNILDLGLEDDYDEHGFPMIGDGAPAELGTINCTAGVGICRSHFGQAT